jgi:tRNA (guanine-N7-)-methyltransferase
MERKIFKNDNPIVLELGCGKGEYSVGLAKTFPEKTLSELILKGQDSGSEPKKL